MAGPFTDIFKVRIEVPSAGEAKQLFDVMEVEVTTTKERKAVAVMGQRKVPRGWTTTIKSVEGTIKVPPNVDPEVDWDDMLDKDVEFNLYLTEHSGSAKGPTRQITGCIIESITRGMSAEGEPTRDINFKALDDLAGR